MLFGQAEQPPVNVASLLLFTVSISRPYDRLCATNVQITYLKEKGFCVAPCSFFLKLRTFSVLVPILDSLLHHFDSRGGIQTSCRNLSNAWWASKAFLHLHHALERSLRSFVLSTVFQNQ